MEDNGEEDEDRFLWLNCIRGKGKRMEEDMVGGEWFDDILWD